MTHLAETGKGKARVEDSDEQQHPRTEAFNSTEIRPRVLPGSKAYREAVKELIIGRMSYDEFISLTGARESDEP